MKRSQINQTIRWAEELCAKHHITLPDFARFAPGKGEFDKAARAVLHD